MARPNLRIPQALIDAEPAIRRACERFGVRELALFGSATSDRFDASQSDVDFLVRFRDMPPSAKADAYFGLLASLEDALARRVDLVEADAITNPYFKSSVEASRVAFYAAA